MGEDTGRLGGMEAKDSSFCNPTGFAVVALIKQS